MPIIHRGKKISVFGDFERIIIALTDMEPMKFRDIWALNQDLTKWIDEQMDKSIAGYEKQT